MSRSSGFASHRLLLALIALPVLGLSFAPAATATTLPSGCTELTAKIATANADPNHGEGDVIVLNGMCDATSLKTSEGVALPKGANFSIEGAPGTSSGLDGSGVTKPLLHNEGFESAGSVALRNLVFQHANASAQGGALQLSAEHLLLAGDQFLENHDNSYVGSAAELIFAGGPCTAAAGAAPWLTVTNSSFRGNTLTASGGFGNGGALFIVQSCAFPGVVLEGNTFEANTLEHSGVGEAEGGGLAMESGGVIGAKSEASTPVTQRGNVFDSNRITSTSTESNFGGGGEWIEGANVTSIGDRFSRNTIPGAGPGKWSWGGGAGILQTECNKVTPTENVLENAVAAGNTIGAGGGALGGAGLYVGCSPSPTHPNHLSLLDSTVTDNTSPAGGVAGVAGNPGDQLVLGNSILAGDVGGSELGGFNGTGGSLTAAFSDVCAPGTSTAIAGEGNICASPRLANEGNPASVDVHETAASPTIDAGSNALVPSGLTTDAFGTTRILAGHIGCPSGSPAVVDMGAAEFPSGSPFCSAPARRPPALTHFVSLRTTSKGAALRLSCSGTSGQGCSGEIFLTTDETRQGKKVIAVGASRRTRVSVRIGQAPFSLPAGGIATFQVKLNPTGLQLLRRFHVISAWVLANEAMPNNSPVIFLLHSTLFRQAKPKHKSKHKSRHAKRRH